MPYVYLRPPICGTVQTQSGRRPLHDPRPRLGKLLLVGPVFQDARVGLLIGVALEAPLTLSINHAERNSVWKMAEAEASDTSRTFDSKDAVVTFIKTSFKTFVKSALSLPAPRHALHHQPSQHSLRTH